MMFQRRVFEFPIRNTSCLSLSYSWIQDLDISGEESAFEVVPSEGIIEPNTEVRTFIIWTLSFCATASNFE